MYLKRKSKLQIGIDNDLLRQQEKVWKKEFLGNKLFMLNYKKNVFDTWLHFEALNLIFNQVR